MLFFRKKSQKTNIITPSFRAFPGYDPQFPEVAIFVMKHKEIRVADIQQEFGFGYNRCGRIADQLVMEGIISESFGSRSRIVLISNPEILYRSKTKEEIEFVITQKQKIREGIIKEEYEEEKHRIAEKILRKRDKRILEKSVQHELIDEGILQQELKRPPIPKDVADAVFSRDKGKCVYCGSTKTANNPLFYSGLFIL